jgi:hypothetical protein
MNYGINLEGANCKVGQMLDYIKKEPELRERFVRKAFEQRKIQDFPDFQQALFEAFSSDRGERAKKFFGEDEVIELFNSEEAKTHLRQNVTEEEFNKIYGDVEQGTYAVISKAPKGEPSRTQDVFTIETPKNIKIKKGYTRTVRGQKISVTAYSRGYTKWSNAQIKFLGVRKTRGLTPKRIIWEYNRHFITETRSGSSITTKIYRI